MSLGSALGRGQPPGKAKVRPEGQGSTGAAPKKQHPLGPTPGHGPGLGVRPSPRLTPASCPACTANSYNPSATHEPWPFMQRFA